MANETHIKLFMGGEITLLRIYYARDTSKHLGILDENIFKFCKINSHL